MSSSVPPSIVRPGAAPEGPPGWEEKRAAEAEAHAQAEAESQAAGHGHASEGAQDGTFDNNKDASVGEKIKEKIHLVGEKLALVPPKGEEDQQVSAVSRLGESEQGKAAVGKAALPVHESSVM